MSIAIITGVGGLIGSEAARHFHSKGLDVVGIDNDMRSYYFGPSASTVKNTQRLRNELPNLTTHTIDVRSTESIFSLFRELGTNVKLVLHTAAQPSHDWAAREPLTDFHVNASGTINLLEATRLFAPDAAFLFTSTNKVYGDTPNSLPLIEGQTRWELPPNHHFFQGIDESMSIDKCMHSLFGASKASADLIVQEYGRYFGLRTVCFRGGCLTGPAHNPAELHGFLAYLVQCVTNGRPYQILGYKGKQVRDNIHSYDLVSAFWEYFKRPIPAAVYNIGGSRFSNCSMLEAISLAEELSGRKLAFTYSDQARAGDHKWWISDISAFQRDYPEWRYQYPLRRILTEMVACCLSA